MRPSSLTRSARPVASRSPTSSLQRRVVERAAQVEHRLVRLELLHDVEHHGAAPRAREAAHVDELEARVGGELGHRLGALEAFHARVVGQHEAELGRAAQCRQLVLGHDDDAGAQRRQALLGDRRGLRGDGPDLGRDVRLAGHGLGHVLVHVVDELRHDRLGRREQRQQLGVVHVQDVGPERAQRLGDLHGAEEAGAAAALRQRREDHAGVVAAGRGAGDHVHDLVAGLGQRAALALVDARVVGLVDDGEVQDASHAATSPVRSRQRRARSAAVATRPPSARVQSTRRQ